MWRQEGVRCHDLVADCALDGGFYFAFRAGGDAGFVSRSFLNDKPGYENIHTLF